MYRITVNREQADFTAISPTNSCYITAGNLSCNYYFDIEERLLAVTFFLHNYCQIIRGLATKHLFAFSFKKLENIVNFFSVEEKTRNVEYPLPYPYLCALILL